MALIEAKPEMAVIVTDVKMPGRMNGFELAQLVSERWPEVGIVVTSAYAIPSDDELPPSAEFLQKPYAAAELLEAVKKVTSITNRARAEFHSQPLDRSLQ